jgi:hypothetical protein
MKVIIYKNDDGGVSVVHPAPGWTAEQCVKDVPKGKEYWFIDSSELPSREYRNEWMLGNMPAPDGVA